MRGFCAGTRASVKRIARRSQRGNYRGNGWSDMRGFCAGTVIDMDMPVDQGRRRDAMQNQYCALLFPIRVFPTA